MHPTLNSSHIISYFYLRSLKLATSGATYPGVPQFGKGYSSALENVARPKSTIFNESN